jgi:hypothetical protein
MNLEAVLMKASIFTRQHKKAKILKKYFFPWMTRIQDQSGGWSQVFYYL